MGSIDYVKHAACYTKWHTSDAENIDMELTSPSTMAHVSHHPRMYPREHWLAGTKGRLIKVLSVACVFSIGLVIGSSARRQIQRNVTLHQSHCDLLPREPYQMNEKILKKLVDSVSRENIESWLWQTTQDFHVGGSDKGSQLAQKIKATWTSQEMKNVRVEVFRPLLSYPDMERANDVRLTKGSRVIYLLKTSPLESQLETHPYMAYSSPGKVRGKPVYVNFGQSEDFDVLKTRGVTLNGTIAIMRYGKGQTLAKIKRAEENGIQGVLIYADPFDTESLDTELPSGPAVSSDAVERGNIKSFPGDPVTPFLPATDDIYRMPRSDVQLPGIPVQPISAEDAQHLLQGIGGPSAPIEWQGRLNLSYSIGPGYKDAAEIEVQLSSYNLFREMTIFNVIGVIPGTHEPGRYIIIGCHHDSWTKGAGDPGSGMAVLMEVARMFSDLIRIEGWRPKRTIIFAAWDAAEFGQVGSTEFLQKHFNELSYRTVAYLSLDQAVTGNRTLQVIGSPLLRQVLSEAAEKVPSPGEDQTANSDQNNNPTQQSQSSSSSSGTTSAQHHQTESLYSSWTRARPALLSSRRGSVPEIIPPASGADFVPFFQLLGVPIAHFQYVARDGATDYPPLRTVYDDFDYIANFTDPGQHAMAALAQLIAATALKLTDTAQLPVKASDYADQISTDFATFQRVQGDFFRTSHIRLDALSAAVKAFSAAAKNFHETFERSAKSDKNILSTLEEYNDRLLQLERSFLLPAAYPRHSHSRHLLYGPDNEDSTKGTLFPHLVMAVKQARKRPISPALSYVRENLSLVLNAIRSATGVLDKSLLLKGDPV